MDGGLTGQQARALQREAAERRLQELAGKPYPVLLCQTCLRLTGWLDGRQRCADCAFEALLSETAHDGRPGFEDYRPRRSLGEVARIVRASFERTETTWRRCVDVGVTGPLRSEDGFELDVATRMQRAAPSGELLVCFAVRRRRFAYSAWTTATSGPRHVPALPGAFPASLETTALAEAWFDFKQDVHEAARLEWEAEQRRRRNAPPPLRRHDLGTPTWLPE